MIESTLDIFLSLVFFMFSLAVIGEPLRVLFCRFSKLFKNLDIIQILVLNVCLGGLVLYIIAIMPFGLFSSATVWVALFFSVSFIVAELLLKRPRFPEKWDALRCAAVLTIFLVTLCIRVIPISDLIFGSIHDTSLHSLFVQLILENRQVPVTLQPYATEGIIYPQGFHPIVAYFVCISDCLVPSAVLYITILFGALSVLGAYYLGRALSPKWYFGVSLALVSAFVASYPKYITWGSNAFIASIPLYFVCLSFVPSLLKEKREFGVSEMVVIGTLFGYLGAVHLQPFETLIASIGLLWVFNIARRKQRAFSRIWIILAVFLISLITVSPFLYRWLIWYPYPYHNIGLAEDVEIPMNVWASYALSNYQDTLRALLNGIHYFWNMLGPYIMLKVIYLIIASLGIIITIVKRKNDAFNNKIVQLSIVTIAGQMLILLLAESFLFSVFSPQPIMLYLSLDMLIAVLAVWLCRSVFLRLSKTAIMKTNLVQLRSSITKNSRVLVAVLLAGMLVYSPFAYGTIFCDPQEIRGAYGVWAITTTDDLELMLWMRDNLPQDSVILVNQFESGLFIPSVSHRKIIFPRTASFYSRSYQTLSTLLENGNLNATACSLMKYLNITHIFIGCYTSIFEMSKHKWNSQPFLQNPNFDLVKKVGNASLFGFSCKYPEVAFQDDFEYDSPTETGWEFYIYPECEETGFGEATISPNHAYHGNKSLMITAKRDEEGYYACWTHKKIYVWDASNMTLSFYVNATSGFNSDLDHSAVIVTDTSWQREITISTSYANISSEYIELPDFQGFFEFNLSEIWHQKYNSELPTEFYICLQNFDADGIKNIAFFDYITLVCKDT